MTNAINNTDNAAAIDPNFPELSKLDDSFHLTHFNSGRPYEIEGQRITVLLDEVANVTHFIDHSRGIDGTIYTACANIDNFFRNYDNGKYEAWIQSPELRGELNLLAKDVVFKDMEGRRSLYSNSEAGKGSTPELEIGEESSEIKVETCIETHNGEQHIYLNLENGIGDNFWICGKYACNSKEDLIEYIIGDREKFTSCTHLHRTWVFKGPEKTRLDFAKEVVKAIHSKQVAHTYGNGYVKLYSTDDGLAFWRSENMIALPHEDAHAIRRFHDGEAVTAISLEGFIYMEVIESV